MKIRHKVSLFQGRLPQSTFPYFPPDMSEPWAMDITDIKVHTTVPSLSDGDTQGDRWSSPSPWLWLLRYPQEARIHVFIDGSATNVASGGTGLLAYFPGGQKATANIAIGKQLLCRNRNPLVGCLHSTGFKSWLQAGCLPLWNHQLPNPGKVPQQVAATRMAVLQWIPAHCGIPGNKQVNILAEEGCQRRTL